MDIFISGRDPALAKHVAAGFEADGHSIMHPWWSSRPSPIREAQRIDAMLRMTACVGAQVLVAFDEHDPIVGLVVGWNVATMPAYHKHAIVVCDVEPGICASRGIHHAHTLNEARSIAFTVAPR